MFQDNVPQNEGLLIIITVSMFVTQKISLAQVKGHMFLSILFLASCLPLSDRLSTWYVKNRKNRQNRCSILVSVWCFVDHLCPFYSFVHCILFPSATHGFGFPLWSIQRFLTVKCLIEFYVQGRKLYFMSLLTTGKFSILLTELLCGTNYSTVKLS